MYVLAFRLAAIIGPVLMLIDVATSENSLDETLPSAIFFGLILAIPFFTVIMGLRKAAKFNKNVSKRTHHDVSNDAKHFAEALYPFLNILEQLGFSYVGQIERRMPSQSDTTRLVYLQPDGLIQAQTGVIHNSTFASFSSIFSDKAVLVTVFPTGFNLSQSYFQSVAVGRRKGLKGAFLVHQRAIMEMTQQHGAPIAIHSIKESIQWEEYFEKQYGEATSQAMHRRGILLLSPYLYLGFWIVFLIGLLLALGGYQPIIGILMAILLIPQVILLILGLDFTG